MFNYDLFDYDVEKIFEDEIELPRSSEIKKRYGYCNSKNVNGDDIYIFLSDLVKYEYIKIKNGDLIAAIDDRCMGEYQFNIDSQYLKTLDKIIFDFYMYSPNTFKVILSKLKYGTLGYLYTLYYVKKIKKEELEEKYKSKINGIDFYKKAVEEYKIDLEIKETFMNAFKIFYEKYKDNKKYENTIEYLNNYIELFENDLVKSKFDLECSNRFLSLEKKLLH